MADQTDFETMSYRLGDNGVAFIAIDVKERSVNVLTPEMHREFGEVAELLGKDESAKGAVIHSAKSSFMAGGDLNRIVGYYDQGRSAEEAYVQSRTYTESLRKLETCGKPVAVAINGMALGGGLELALACHHRVVQDDDEILLGLPEVTLGLLPGGGGTQRLPRLIGLEKAAELILSGKTISPAEALELGIVDQVQPAHNLLAAAEKWVLEEGNSTQPWDQRGFRVPGGAKLNDMNIGRLFQKLTVEVGVAHRHNYPAPVAILRCLFNGTTVNSMDAALKIETREFSALTRDPVARNMIRTLFINKAKAGRPDQIQQALNEKLREACEAAYISEVLNLRDAGVKPALIRNAAFATGMPKGPLALADSEAPGDAQVSAIGVEEVKQRLLCAQALAAAECWERGEIEPVAADLASVLGWKFPSYTGGVISYIDTMGLGAFIALLDKFAEQGWASGKPSEWLRAKAGEGDRIYPSVA